MKNTFRWMTPIEIIIAVATIVIGLAVGIPLWVRDFNNVIEWWSR